MGFSEFTDFAHYFCPVDIEDLVESNELNSTKVSWSVYWQYIRAMGGLAILIFLLVSFAVSIAVQSAATWFLAFWLMQGNGASLSFCKNTQVNPESHKYILDKPTSCGFVTVEADLRCENFNDKYLHAKIMLSHMIVQRL